MTWAPSTDAAPPPPPPPPVERLVHLPYHRLLRAQPTYRWWRPLVALAILGAWIIVVTAVLLGIVMVIAVVSGAVDVSSPTVQDDFVALALPDMSNPVSMLVGLGSVAIWLPGVAIALRLAGIRPAGPRTNITHSVTFRLRWGWMLRCLVPAVVVTAVGIGGSVGLGVLLSGSAAEPAPIDLSVYALSLLLVVLLVPFQAAAEEYVFRGMLMQALGAWIPWLWVALVVPTVLFALGHIYDIWGLIDVAVFGIAAAVVTWRTGGLEAAIAMHTVNNVAAFAILGSGVTGETGMTVQGSSPLSILLTIVTMAAFLLWVDRMAARRSIARLSNIRVLEPATPLAG